MTTPYFSSWDMGVSPTIVRTREQSVVRIARLLIDLAAAFAFSRRCACGTLRARNITPTTFPSRKLRRSSA